MNVVAAKNHFWDLGITDLQFIAQHLEISIPDKPSLLDVLVVLTTEILQISEDAALDILAPRLNKLTKGHSQTAVDQFMELDEASKLLTREDEEELHKEQEKQREAQDRTMSFLNEFKEKKKAIKAHATTGNTAKEHTLYMPSAEELNHEKAKKLLPVGCYIWRAWSHDAWEGRCPQIPQ